jgi:hypothetical protein
LGGVAQKRACHSERSEESQPQVLGKPEAGL